MVVMSPLDSMFLLMESREHPMHVGGLSLFAPRRGGGHTARSLYDDLTADSQVGAMFRRRPGRLLQGFSVLQWAIDDEVEIEYHVQLLSLPAPGRVRELLELVSMLHGSLLDRHRPLWEVYVIDGLADGRIALYAKTHHALMDGVSAVRTWHRALSPDPASRECLPPWRARPRPVADVGSGPVSRSTGAVRALGRLGAAIPATVSGAYGLARDYPHPRPFQAPATMFNVPITGARRFAAQSWPLDRLRGIAVREQVTLNDVVLAMCAGALRGYLRAEDALPAQPLIAMVPISLRGREDDGDRGSEGNAVGAALCDLATDSADPRRRLARIHNSMNHAKSAMAKLTPLQMLGVSAVNVAGLALPALPVPLPSSAPPFNIVISNVPGAAEPRYWNGLRLEAMYPASIPLDGQAVNITTISSGGSMHFGIVGCRRTVPHLQRLLTDLDRSLDELETGTPTRR
ncbi:diacylglycerol O-acyltransferase [Nocardia neocaledoniensis NBRC 108232]|uniref:Diacylglycerol O-acyltransferase n=1 Tax=Nocardia neocaledoniensis TaxID=236511 RepID=A0A317N7E8_9NOCA|nr:wax ester/triacylglycerol synthase family O-acyltransferase [Nocardia neocaledoniensis]PWV71060.1 WS/DGAT/MGAT family acyltransferase [Nocardia neocaledoniensis]GEM30271.1 diacylglycerol O-acyltransferase [Nocardia neocaledoniensis NBRC 108232]